MVADPQVRIGENGVTQPIPERIQGLFLHIPVSAAFHAVIGKRRQLSKRFDEGHRQPAGRVIVAKQYSGQSGPSFLSGIPGLYYSVDVFLCPVYCYGTAVKKCQNNGFSCGRHSFQQFFLHPGKLQVSPVPAANSDGERPRHIITTSARPAAAKASANPEVGSSPQYPTAVVFN